MSNGLQNQSSKMSLATTTSSGKVRKKVPSLVRFFSKFKICRLAKNRKRIAPPDKIPSPFSPSFAQLSLGDFQRIRTIGTGSFGRVFLVIHSRTKLPYALKVLNKHQIIETRQLPHTINERKILSILKHPFMVHLVASFQDVTNLYLLMDYVPGGELFSILRRLGRFSNASCKFYAAELILILGHLHLNFIVYRDLKPENILLDAKGHVVLTDFGFAKVVSSGGLTRTLCGTPEYIAPEIILGREYGIGVDWYALGVLIYEMLVGVPPFTKRPNMNLYEVILGASWSFPPDLDPLAVDLILRLCTPDPTVRLGVLLNGIHDIMDHPWFDDIQWDQLLKRKIEPPMVPTLASSMDTRYFETYAEDESLFYPSCLEHTYIEDWDYLAK